MKNLLQTLANLLWWYYFSFNSFLGVIWYGRLPKVSIYHLYKYNSLYEDKHRIFNDEKYQVTSVTDVSEGVKQRIIDAYIDALYQDETFKNNVASVNIPLFNGKEIIGSQSLRGVLRKVKEELL